MSRVLSLVACIAVLHVTATCAQEPAQPQNQNLPQTQPAAPSAIDPTKLGISFDRVRMQLSHPDPAKSNGLKIQETIEVVGKAPVPLLWNPNTVNLKSAAVPFGAPTQKDIMKLITPKEFQNYPFDLNALTQWLMEHMNKKTE